MQTAPLTHAIMPDDKRPINVVIVSGYSGAGKTVALRALEDVGYFCIDNLPISLIGSFLSTASDADISRKIGIGVDIREKVFQGDAEKQLAELRKHLTIEIVFLEAETDVLVRRFKETRRPHPLMTTHGGIDLDSSIAEEIKQLGTLRDAADSIIDTSSYSLHQLRHLITSRYSREVSDRQMNITVVSFGFKYGVPSGLDLLFDVRFLPNPYFVQELKALTGRHRELIDFVMGQEDTTAFLEHVLPLLSFLVPRYIREGKTYLSIGVGCTGGRHRSPVVAERIVSHLEGSLMFTVNINHRDMETHGA